VHCPREVGAIGGKSLHLISCNSDSMLLRQDLYLTTREKVSLEKKTHIPIYLHIYFILQIKICMMCLFNF